MTTNQPTCDDPHDDLHTLDALLELAASDEDGNRVPSPVKPGPLRRVLARLVWTATP